MFEIHFDNGFVRGTTTGETLTDALQKMEEKAKYRDSQWRDYIKAFFWNGEYLESVDLPENAATGGNSFCSECGAWNVPDEEQYPHCKCPRKGEGAHQ